MRTKSRMGKRAVGALLISLLPLVVMAYQGPGLNRGALNGTLSLYQSVEVDKGARIHIQDGEVKRFQNINHIEPYCYFYSSRRGRELDNPFIVHSADFLITHVQQRRDVVLNQSYQVASSFFGFGHGGTQFTLATEFMLDNTIQPDLRSLVCAVWADPRDRGHVTQEEIQTLLGPIADFKVPGS